MTLLTCTPTRLRTATDSYAAIALLCLDLAPRSSQAPSNLPVRPETLRKQVGQDSSGILSCPTARLNSPQALFNPHKATALAA
jgi:hypothetical protein